ncbi:hypothetical protein GCM10007036_14300 [Alsobacter metallidurans]|uniref:Uncharacterized protein n=1 Tax=Alsobacter metallidurans TaxID=340221 RepID=A0A917MH29_9HYPH|nr:hypothetical protein [Alsobacter metallidurans]GGH14764.1 hypothetical protein GCM10007036_14300 [Alsobacter metallidurans]
MPFVDKTRSTDFWEPGAFGPVCQLYGIPTLPTAFPTTIAGSGAYDSGLVCADGFKAMALGLTADQSGSMQITRYLDPNGLVLQGGPVSIALVGGQAKLINITDALPFAYYRVQITNGAGSLMTITNACLLLNAA